MRRRNRGIMVELCGEPTAISLPAETCAACTRPDITDLWLFVRRRGTFDWLLKYPAWDIDEAGRIRFLLDSQFPTEPGRYDGEVRIGDEDVVGYVEIEIKEPLRIVGPAEVARRTPTRRRSRPDGATDMYQAIENFETTLCDILEPTATILPISDADRATLCGATLCRPAQLVIDDGVHREIVEWSCTPDGQIELVRAVTGGEPHRFPAGSQVFFDWTEANVVNAMQGC